MMSKLKPYLGTVVIVLITLAVASRIGFVRKLVFNAPA